MTPLKLLVILFFFKDILSFVLKYKYYIFIVNKFIINIMGVYFIKKFIDKMHVAVLSFFLRG